MELTKNKMYRVKMIVAMTDGSPKPQIFVGKYNGLRTFKILGNKEVASFSRQTGSHLNIWLASLTELIWAKEVRYNWDTDCWVNIN